MKAIIDNEGYLLSRNHEESFIEIFPQLYVGKILVNNPTIHGVRLRYFNDEWIDVATDEEKKVYNSKLCPQTITRRQLRKQLVILGFDLAVIESMITDPLTLIDWQDSTIFERQNESVISIGTNLEIDLNDFFTNASLL